MALPLLLLENGLFHSTLLSCCIFSLGVYLWLRPASAIHNIPGPRSPSWLFGHMAQLRLSQPYGAYEFGWQKLYGPVYRIFGCFGQERLMISDPVALQYILNSPDVAIGPDLANAVRLLFGEKCSMGVDNEAHKRLRVALNAGFTAAAVRSYLDVIEQAARTLADKIEESSDAWINVCPLLSQATLSTVSEVILGYSITDLGEEFMANNFKILAIACNQSSLQIMADAIGACLPSWLRGAAKHLPTEQFKTIRRAKYLADRKGAQSVRERRDSARQGLEMDTDLYGKLVNSSDTLQNRLSEDEIVAQTALIMVAGQDTTSNTLSFGLLELARAPELQTQLREEIHASQARGAAYDSMPLLNAFIKECLRLYPAAAIADRIAVEDMVIPLTNSIMTTTGEELSQIPIRKGQILMVAIASYQRLESGWGEHAMEFNPRRWLDENVYKEEAADGVYANLLAFLGGPRACLGWRFAILEMQVFFCELIGKFTFALPEGQSTSTRFTTTLMPTMANGQKGAPLCVKRFV
ncbi:cytochrome P450 [Mycena vitilis]|nr:cytochrome P450 [Mycena vitilis]